MRRSLALALSLLGWFDSAYLWWVYTSPSRPMVCLGSGCEVVRASPFAQLWGFPLPAYGVAMYTALALLIFAAPLLSARLARPAHYAIAGVSGAGFLVSLYLTGLEAFVLHAWCTWCVISALSVTFIFTLAIVDVLQPAPHPEPAAALALVRRYLVVFIVAAALGVPAFYWLSRHGELPPFQPPTPQVLAAHLVHPDSHMTGNLQSPVTVVQFGDFQCPACAAAEETARQIRMKYGNQVRFVFRQFPLAHIHPQAEKAAEASECAAEQGKFWEAVEKIYQGDRDLSESGLTRDAGELHLDAAQFKQCLSRGAMAAHVRRDVEDGRALGIRATPTFFVGQLMVEGTPDLAQFGQLLDQELRRSGAAFAASRPSSDHPPKREQPPVQPSSAGRGAVGHTPSAAGSLLASGGSGAFTQFQSSTTACSEEEAQKQQPTLIRTPEARELFEGRIKGLFVDVRQAADFKSGRIPGAINIPADKIEGHWSGLPKDRNIVLYESGRSAGDVCGASRAASRVLLAHGFPLERVKVYQEGLAGWEKAGLPIDH